MQDGGLAKSVSLVDVDEEMRGAAILVHYLPDAPRPSADNFRRIVSVGILKSDGEQVEFLIKRRFEESDLAKKCWRAIDVR